MKYIKPYNESKESIKSICIKYGIENYTINEDESIDANNVYLHKEELSKLPLKFNKVVEFYCNINKLTSLEGSPNEAVVFNCKLNQLTSLKGSPKIVVDTFNCSNNYLTSLEDGPERVGWTGTLPCGYFYCAHNQLTSLEGGPKYIGTELDCRNNIITSLKGLPEDFKGDLYINNNKLTSVRGLPEDFEGGLFLVGNPVYELFELFESLGPLGYYRVAHLLNEYDVISLDGKKIYRDNLEEVFDVLGIEMWFRQAKDLKLRNYEIH